MKNVLAYLIQSYYNIITNANIVLNGYVLPVYDGMAPDSEIGSYILISADRTAVQVADKCTYAYNATVLIDVVIKNGSFSLVDSDNVAEQIALLINTNNNPQPENFQIVKTQTSWNNLTSLNLTEPVFRTLLRYTHFIVQND